MRRVLLACGFLVGLTLLTFALSPFSFAQLTFERAYGGAAYDHGECVQQTSDGGYIITGLGGWIQSTFQGYVYLLKTDSLGDTLWSKTFGADSGVDCGMSVQQTLDGGYIVVGYTRELGPGLNDVYLIKTDSVGDTLWTRIYGGIEMDDVRSVQQTQDGGYILAGGTASFGDTLGELYLIKTDSQGDTIWTRTYGAHWSQGGNSVRQTSDGGYIITGDVSIDSIPQTSDVYLVKTDAQGDTLWTRIYGNPGIADRGESVQEASDGGYVVAGTACFSSSSGGFDKAYLIKTDSQGDTLWTRTYVHRDRSRGLSVAETYDGGYIVAGESFQSDGGGRLVYIVRTDSMGDTLWTRTYGYSAVSRARSVWQTSDSGFVVAGDIRGSITQLEDVYLIKMDDFGRTEPQRDMSIVSIDSPADTVFTETWCEPMATLRSYGNTIDSADATASINGYAETVEGLRLLPGCSLQVHFVNWFVPSADSTTYTMTVCARVPGDIDTTNDCMQKTIFAYNPTGVEEGLNRPFALDFRLWQNEPNPFHRSTGIRYSLPVACDVTLTIYDVAGRPVTVLVSEEQTPGVHNVAWDGKFHASGIYFYRLEAESFVETRKMALAR